MGTSSTSRRCRALEGATRSSCGSAMKTKLHIQPKSCRAASQQAHGTARCPLKQTPFLSPSPMAGLLWSQASCRRLSTRRHVAAAKESPRAAGANPRLQCVCQIEHRLKQLRKLLSRILAPRGSKPARRLLDACQASSVPTTGNQ